MPWISLFLFIFAFSLGAFVASLITKYLESQGFQTKMLTMLVFLDIYILFNVGIVLFLRYQGDNMGWNQYFLRKSLDKAPKIDDNESSK